MVKRMIAKYRGCCSCCGAAINRGDAIAFDTVARAASHDACHVRALAGDGGFSSDLDSRVEDDMARACGLL